MALVVWYVTSFGWTEIVFDVFLEKIFRASNIQNVSLVRKCRYYNKGAKPTVRSGKNGLTGLKLLEEALEMIESEIAHKNHFPDMFIFSDDADCRIVYDANTSAYIYNLPAYQATLNNLVSTIQNHNNQTKVVFMFASPEIESWFLADCKSSFCMEFSGFSLQGLNSMCGGILPISNIENFGGGFVSDSYSSKLSDDCIAKYTPSFGYSKRQHGQKFLQQIDPASVKSLKFFFEPAFDAIENNLDFFPK